MHLPKGFILLVMLIVCMLSSPNTLQMAEAIRPLGREKWLIQKSLLLQSLPRGPTPPSGPSPCTQIPGGGDGSCP
nr:hypothetical protein CK203_113442 [Ipomoea trifida]